MGTNSRGVLTRERAEETGGLANGFSSAGCGNAPIANRSSRGRKAGAKAESRFEMHLRSGLGGMGQGVWRGRGEDIVFPYDPGTNTWEYRKPLSSPRMWFAAAIGPDDRIYLFGGAAGMADKASTPVLNTTEIYNPKTDTWSSGKPMPEPRVAHDAVFAANGKIYVMGGSNKLPTEPLSDVFIYDPARDSWEKGSSMHARRSGFASVATPGGKIYAIGGTDVGAYKAGEKLNIFLPKENEVYTGEVQNTVEVLDVSK
jgi:N-acetylneuraminic acid mutarotase